MCLEMVDLCLFRSTSRRWPSTSFSDAGVRNVRRESQQTTLDTRHWRSDIRRCKIEAFDRPKGRSTRYFKALAKFQTILVRLKTLPMRSDVDKREYNEGKLGRTFHGRTVHAISKCSIFHLKLHQTNASTNIKYKNTSSFLLGHIYCSVSRAWLSSPLSSTSGDFFQLNKS